MAKNRLYKLRRTDEVFPWVWALRSQISLFEANDARWIRDAADGWSEESFHRFLVSYSLVRGKKGSFLSREADNGRGVILKRSGQKLLRLCKKYYAPPLPKKDFVKEISKRWRKVDRQLRAYALKAADLDEKTREIIGKNSDFLPSATLKAFWFYQPDKLTMYDSLNCRGLKEEMEVKITTDNFLEKFYEFYGRHKQNIKKAAVYADRDYPYPYRLADKYLWLMGNDNRDIILDNFEASINVEHRQR